MVGFIQIWETPYQLSRGFVRAELSNVGVLPKDVEGDATFGFQLINLMHRSFSPRVDAVAGGGEAAAHWLVHFCGCMCKRVTTGGDKFCTLQHLSLAVDLDLSELLCSAALGKPKSSRVSKDS